MREFGLLIGERRDDSSDVQDDVDALHACGDGGGIREVTPDHLEVPHVGELGDRLTVAIGGHGERAALAQLAERGATPVAGSSRQQYPPHPTGSGVASPRLSAMSCSRT